MLRVVGKVSILVIIALVCTGSYWWFAMDHSSQNLKSALIFCGAALLCCGAIFAGNAKPNTSDKLIWRESKMSDEQRFWLNKHDTGQSISTAVLFLMAGIIPLTIGLLI